MAELAAGGPPPPLDAQSAGQVPNVATAEGPAESRQWVTPPSSPTGSQRGAADYSEVKQEDSRDDEADDDGGSGGAGAAAGGQEHGAGKGRPPRVSRIRSVDTQPKFVHPQIAPMSYRLGRLSVYSTAATMLLVGYDARYQRYRVVKIDRRKPSDQVHYSLHTVVTELPAVFTLEQVNSFLSTLHSESAGGLQFVMHAVSIIGVIRFVSTYYLLLITEATVVGCIGAHVIYSISGTEMLPVSPTNEQSERSPWQWFTGSILHDHMAEQESRYKSIFQEVDITKDFFFSFTYDMTKPLQQHLRHQAADAKLPPDAFATESSEPNQMGVLHDMYIWNSFLAAELLQCVGTHWVVPVIHGFFKQISLSMVGRPLSLTLLARRSRYFAGPRYLKRGVNDKGQAANEVEVEQIIEDHAGRFASFVQVRGSIPVYWTQVTSVAQPKPDVQLIPEPLYKPARLHFADMFRRYGGPILAVNLVKTKERRKRERALGDEYASAVAYVNKALPPERRIQYWPFDFSQLSRSKRHNVLEGLKDVAEWVFVNIGMFCNSVVAGVRLPPELAQQCERGEGSSATSSTVTADKVQGDSTCHSYIEAVSRNATVPPLIGHQWDPPHVIPAKLQSHDDQNARSGGGSDRPSNEPLQSPRKVLLSPELFSGQMRGMMYTGRRPERPRGVSFDDQISVSSPSITTPNTATSPDGTTVSGAGDTTPRRPRRDPGSNLVSAFGKYAHCDNTDVAREAATTSKFVLNVGQSLLQSDSSARGLPFGLALTDSSAPAGDSWYHQQVAAARKELDDLASRIRMYLSQCGPLKYFYVDLVGDRERTAAGILPWWYTISDGDHKQVFVNRTEYVQHGVVRSNCVDCLDRTNVAQFCIGVFVLGQQLHCLGYVGSPSLSPKTQAVASLMELYEEMGDILALQYGGSEAHKKVGSQPTGAEKKQSKSRGKELVTSIRRYVSNAFTDTLKQDGINLFLGIYRPLDHVHTLLWEMESDFGLHHGSVCKLYRQPIERPSDDWWSAPLSEWRARGAGLVTVPKHTKLAAAPVPPSSAALASPTVSSTSVELAEANPTKLAASIMSPRRRGLVSSVWGVGAGLGVSRIALQNVRETQPSPLDPRHVHAADTTKRVAAAQLFARGGAVSQEILSRRWQMTSFDSLLCDVTWGERPFTTNVRTSAKASAPAAGRFVPTSSARAVAAMRTPASTATTATMKTTVPAVMMASRSSTPAVMRRGRANTNQESALSITTPLSVVSEADSGDEADDVEPFEVEAVRAVAVDIGDEADAREAYEALLSVRPEEDDPEAAASIRDYMADNLIADDDCSALAAWQAAAGATFTVVPHNMTHEWHRDTPSMVAMLADEQLSGLHSMQEKEYERYLQGDLLMAVCVMATVINGWRRVTWVGESGTQSEHNK